MNAIQLSLRSLSGEQVPPGEFIELPGRGRTFAADIAGPPGAPTLFLLHGLAVTGYLNWFPAFSTLAQQFRVVCMDLRGHGRGIPLDRRFRLADCADDVVALADALGIERFVPVGYSLGGPVAQLVWRRHPERVDGMVLSATSRNFGGTRQERWFYSTLLAAIYGIQVGRHLPGPFGSDPVDPTTRLRQGDGGGRLAPWALAELRQASPAVVLQAMNAMGRFTSHAWVSEIDVPTAVVVTTRDRFIAPDRQLKLPRAPFRGQPSIRRTQATPPVCSAAARFVPSLLEACRSVADRLEQPSARQSSTS